MVSNRKQKQALRSMTRAMERLALGETAIAPKKAILKHITWDLRDFLSKKKKKNRRGKRKPRKRF